MVRLSLPFTAAATLFASSMALCSSKNGLVQMLTHVKRHPNFTQTEFWDYWYSQHAPKVAPLAAHFNITRYQQIQVGGRILPTEAGATEPASNETVEFDGVALFLYRAPEDLAAMISHPYYLEVVLPDEHVFIDKTAFGGGQVATFVGTHVEVLDDQRDIWVGNKADREKYQAVFDSYEK
ncbi:ethyl tert-butyl ether degradation [Colletotrichum truncatum]|uniref:Ethyl tert-butyl ether degradation n=1 Tax=Colletotrichum truncatum TaxID=5467 RepID=A0ACC3YRM9_COLTU|nr:ethyl tert-butyl ether degradation [Colletotrichum truncatum]KAF6799328.1 ethyl tert-butyl ether degradation [Colletotrichum truncatum]